MVKYILTGVLSAASVAGTGYTYVTGLQGKVTALQTQNAQYAQTINAKNAEIRKAIQVLEAAAGPKTPNYDLER